MEIEDDKTEDALNQRLLNEGHAAQVSPGGRLVSPTVEEKEEAIAEQQSVRDSVECKRSWMMLVNVYIGLLVTYGLMSTVGVFHVIFLQEMRENNAITSWIGSINSSTTMISSWICSLLLRRYSARAMIMSGVLLCALGLVGSSVCNSVIQLVLTFGLLTGSGVGITYMGMSECMNQWFDTHLPIATGIGSSALGMTSFIYPPIIRELTRIYQWRGALLILGAIVLQYLVLACFTKPPKTKAEQKLKLNDIFSTKLFHSRLFVCFLIAELGFHIGVSIVQVHLENFVKARGIESSHWAIPVFGISNALSRLIFGLVGNIPRIDAQSMMTMFVSLGGACLFVIPSVESGTGVLFCTAVYGFFMGVIGYATYVVVVNYFDQELMACAFGYVCLSNGLGFLVGAPLAGFLYDVTSQYAYSLYVGGALHIISWLPLIVTTCAKRRLKEIKLDPEDDEQRTV